MGHQWKSGWSVEKPLDFTFDWSPAKGALWTAHNSHGAMKRDLGLYDASKGLMRATQYRYNGAGSHESSDWRCHDLDFQFIYVVAGTATLVTDTARHPIGQGASITQPGFTWYRLEDISDDFETVEVVGPGDYDTYWGRETALPARAGEIPAIPASYSMLSDDSYVDAAGPRTYFRYRDLGTAGPTEDRVYIHAVSMVPPVRVGGTGWHNHTMRQWIFILGGSADIEVEVDGEIVTFPVSPADCMTIYAGQVHDVPRYTEDYHVLEMCIPKEYGTTAIQRPTS